MSSNSLTNHDVGRPPRLRVFLSEWRGATYGPDEEICCRDDRHVLAYVRGLRFGRHRRRVPASRDRIAGGLAGLRPHRSHDGVFHRPHLRMSPQSRRDHRPDSRWPLPINQVAPYVIAQVVGAVIAAVVLYVIASGAPGFDLGKGFAANGYGEHSPGKYGLVSAFVAEFVLTAMFLFVIMGSTHGKAPVGFAPLAIGLGLTLIHLVSIPVTNTSVNPARSTGPALFVGGWALAQLWLFWVAPLVGGALGGVIYRWISEEPG